MMSADRKFRRGSRSTGERDEILGAALRRLEVPPHRPGFHADLLAMLGTAVSEPDVADPERPSTPRWAQPRRGRLRHPRGWMLGLAAAAAAVLTLFLGVANFPGTKPTTASAAEVQAAVARAWASARGIAGVLIVRYRNPANASQQNGRWRFLLTAQGDFRLTGLNHPGVVVYDASAGIERSLNTSASMPGSKVLFASELTGLAPGAPDPGPPDALLDKSLGSVVRAIAAGHGGHVRQVTYQGRAAWLLDMNIRTSKDLFPDHLQVTVDRQTGFPVSVRASREGQTIYETRIQDFTVNPRIRLRQARLHRHQPACRRHRVALLPQGARSVHRHNSTHRSQLESVARPAGHRTGVRPSATAGSVLLRSPCRARGPRRHRSLRCSACMGAHRQAGGHRFRRPHPGRATASGRLAQIRAVSRAPFARAQSDHPPARPGPPPQCGRTTPPTRLAIWRRRTPMTRSRPRTSGAHV